MRWRVASAAIVFGGLFLSYVSYVPSQPSFNGATPGCGGSGCHTFQAGIASATPKANLQVSVSLSGTTGKVAGELVDTTGTVVATVNSSSTNPLTLTAPGPGRYTVNAGFLSPSRRWDSLKVNLTLTDVSGRDVEPASGTFKLDQNYPNPFNPATSIGYSVAHDSRVTLKIYNMIGELVSAVVDKNVTAGSYSARVDLSGLPSGIYMYRIEATSLQESTPFFTQTRKMALVK
jgi:hypothetical protein